MKAIDFTLPLIPGLWKVPSDCYRKNINLFLHGLEVEKILFIDKTIGGNCIISLSSEYTWLGKKIVLKKLSNLFDSGKFRLSNFCIHEVLTNAQTVMLEVTTQLRTPKTGYSILRLWIIFRFNNKHKVIQTYFYSNMANIL